VLIFLTEEEERGNIREGRKEERKEGKEGRVMTVCLFGLLYT
jgi:hypothetical protein